MVLNASIVGYFEKEAIKTVSTWTYQPATWNGNPVAQANMTASIIFTMTNSNVEVTGSFRSNYEKANTAILGGDLSGAKSIIDKLDSGKKKRLSEVCHLDILKATYWQSRGDNAETLHYVNRALVIADVAVSNDMYTSLLRQAIAAEEASHNYISALNHYKTLLEVEGDISADDPIRGVVKQIEEVIGSEGAIVTNGKISQCADCLPDTLYWHHFLNRNRFSIAQVTGEVGEIEILCGFQSVSLIYNPEAILSVEKDWGQCYLRVFGEQGTILQLTEF